MFEIGRMNALTVHHVDGSGGWMQAGQNQILLPQREMPPQTRPGDRLTVFVYRDASGKLAATLRHPKAQVGEFARLKVSQVTKHGAFLNWGLEKELLVPFAEQPERMQTGRRYMVKIGLDSLGRVVGTGRIDRCLETEEIDLVEGEAIDLMIWQFTELGAKVIINDLYGGLLYKDEIRGDLTCGNRLKGYVKRIREDKKIDVTLRKGGSEEIEKAKALILASLQKSGFLPLHDQSPPWVIQEKLGMSKKTFKKAVGGLYKAGIVELTDEGIRLKKS